MRYLPLNTKDRAAMLSVIGVNHIDDLFVDVPKSARLSALVDLPNHQSEAAVERHMSRLSNKSVSAGSVPFFCGAGAYKHHIPATVDHLIQRSEFLTAYTPYQPEISQGTLQALFEFQTQVALLTGMDVANASMYDGSTACAEAVVMARRVTRKNCPLLSRRLSDDQRESFLRLWDRLPLHFRDITFDLHGSGWFPSVISSLRNVRCDFPDVFSASKTDFGSCSLVPLKITVPSDSAPITSRPYRINPIIA